MSISRRRRWPWFLLLLIVGIALLVPGLLGRFVHHQTSVMLSESWPEATVRWQRGWFASRVEAADRDAHLVLDARHALLDPAGPLSARGTLTLARPEARIDLDGRLSWAMDTVITARTPSLRSDEEIAIDAEQVQLDLRRSRDGALDLRVDAAMLVLAGPPDARLTTRDTRLRITTDGADPGMLTIDLSTTQTGRAPSRLSIQARQIDSERAQALRETMAIAVQTPPGGPAASIAWLGVASAWEQLARGGLTIELAPLSLNGETDVEGRWVPADGPPTWRGGGPQGAVEDWWLPILGLVRAEPVDRLRWELERQIERLADQGVLRRDGNRLDLVPTSEPPR